MPFHPFENCVHTLDNKIRDEIVFVITVIIWLWEKKRERERCVDVLVRWFCVCVRDFDGSLSVNLIYLTSVVWFFLLVYPVIPSICSFLSFIYKTFLNWRKVDCALWLSLSFMSSSPPFDAKYTSCELPFAFHINNPILDFIHFASLDISTPNASIYANENDITLPAQKRSLFI